MNKIVAAVYLAGAAFFIVGGPAVYASAAVLTLGTAYFFNEFVVLGHFFDRFFKKRTGANVIGIVEPQSDVRQQIIVSSHHDSTPVCNFLEKRQSLYAFRLVLPMVFHLLANAAALLASVGIGSDPAGQRVFAVLKIIVLAGGAFVVPLFWYFGRGASPGAGDNLVSSVMLVKLAELFKAGGRDTALRHTRLVFLSADGEECGQRGSLHYAKTHEAELRGIETFVFNVDSLYRVRDLAFLTTDTNGLVRLSEPWTAESLRVSDELGYAVKAIRLPFGGGGTDAGRFARIGVKAASLIGMSTRLIRKDIVYHTSRDTVENIEPEAVEAGFNIIANVILEKDGASSR